MKYAFIAVLAVALLAALAVYAIGEDKPAAGAAGGEAAKVLPPEAAVVAAMPYKEETEYEQDPFDATKLKRTRTVVTHVLLVRSDGTTMIKSAP
jgi:hypothetical protein